MKVGPRNYQKLLVLDTVSLEILRCIICALQLRVNVSNQTPITSKQCYGLTVQLREGANDNGIPRLSSLVIRILHKLTSKWTSLPGDTIEALVP